MHIDGHSLEANTVMKGDVCIIGAGAAGISFALEWINTPYNVILLEGGGFEYEEEIQSLFDGETTGQNYFPIKSTRLHLFGGTTWLWAGMSSPLDPIDFTSRDWVPDSGWPFSKEDLDPFYARAQDILYLGDHPYDLKYWQAKIPKMNPFPLNGDVVWNKMWQHSKITFGYYKKKIIEATNIHLITHANVVDIVSNDEVSAIKRLVTKNHKGKKLFFEANNYVLACGAIQNSRLLLSANSQAPNGLGNDNDLVGRYFMEHIEIASSELKLVNPFPTSLYEINHGITRANAELAINEKAQIKYKILNGTASLFPLDIGRHLKPRIDTWIYKDIKKSEENTLAQRTEAIEKAKQENNEDCNNAFQLITRMEQAPNPNSRITLGSKKDALGVPYVNLHWELTGLEKRSIRKLHELIGKEMQNSQIGHVKLLDFLEDENDESFPISTTAGWHHMGTTRMNDNPKKGVVDSNCQVHGVSNLFVAGSSCFPTSGAPNPTLTLVALTLRLADHVKQVLIDTKKIP